MLRRAVSARSREWESTDDRIDMLPNHEDSVSIVGQGQCRLNKCASWATVSVSMSTFDAQGLHVTTLADIADMLRCVRREAGLSQSELAQRAGLARTTVTRMETLAKGDMSVSALVRLLEAAGYHLKLEKHGHVRTLEVILAEQRQDGGSK